MTLPDITGLTGLPGSAWRDLAKQLRRIGLSPARVAPVVTTAAAVHPALRRPVRSYHLRKMKDAAAHAMRMLMFGDPVGEAEARAALGDSLSPMLDAGVVARTDRGIVSPFVLSLFNELFLFSDELSHGGDAVMGFGEGTIELCRAAFPERPIQRALDLGCGSGTCALVLSAAASRVVGTDINPRALELARVNATLNGITNVEFREGDLFAPVAGETFDVVASQPPFVPMPEGSGDAVFLYGGRLGDELALAVLSQIGRHLAPGGRAVLRVDWPEYGDAPLADRLARALGSRAAALILAAPVISPEDHAAAYSSGIHPLLDAGFDAEVERRLAHLERASVRAIAPTLTVVRPAPEGAASAERLDVVPLVRAAVTAGHVDALLSAREVARSPDALLAARLRVPDGTALSQEQVGPGAEVPSTLWARFADAALVPPMSLSPELLFLVTAVHEADDVRSGIAAFAEQAEIPLEVALAQAAPAIARALATGLLQVDPATRA